MTTARIGACVLRLEERLRAHGPLHDRVEEIAGSIEPPDLRDRRYGDVDDTRGRQRGPQALRLAELEKVRAVRQPHVEAPLRFDGAVQDAEPVVRSRSDR